mgnify:CR=1 FL=1
MNADTNGHPSSPDEESMPYGIMGEDNMSDRDKLEKYSGEVDWSYLKPHYKSGALIFVDPALSITLAGEAFTNDDLEQVASWRKSGEILTPSDPHAEFWEKENTLFLALVVSPFVLIQPIDSSDSD